LRSHSILSSKVLVLAAAWAPSLAPVRRHTELRILMHLLGTDLDLHRLALLPTTTVWMDW
jgi:hypothetical protein